MPTAGQVIYLHAPQDQTDPPAPTRAEQLERVGELRQYFYDHPEEMALWLAAGGLIRAGGGAQLGIVMGEHSRPQEFASIVNLQERAHGLRQATHAHTLAEVGEPRRLRR
jgi:hypothetical protein